jgi:hypothetical protein
LGGRWRRAWTSAVRCFDHESIKPDSPLEGAIQSKV